MRLVLKKSAQLPGLVLIQFRAEEGRGRASLASSISILG
jgi:hypothetical protein